MNILEATKDYETWMRRCTTVVESDLRLKHQQMKDDPYLFLRGTYYRWAQLWPKVCSDLRRAPRVLASGDVHVGNFGTWRDAEGRLAWGVDDFDEAYPLPYTNDLVRLAASVKIASGCAGLSIKLKNGCAAILEAYRETLKKGGCPIVLAEHGNYLNKLGIVEIKRPDDFWKRLNALPTALHGLPRDANNALRKMLPDPRLDHKIVRREAGIGSLGQERFVAIANWDGGCIAREAKAMVPSASIWLEGREGHGQANYRAIITNAVRSHDPFQRIVGRWLLRRLSPDSDPIHIADLPSAMRNEETLLYAMGSEVANVHLGSKRAKSILSDMRRRKPNWLRAAAKDMAKTMMREWKDYKKS
jgi:hypothetical protein